MYIVKYGDAYLHDPRGDESLLTDAKLSGGLNQAGSLVFTMAPNHPLLGTVRERDSSSPVEVYDGGVLVFAGYVWELSQDFKNTRTASCKGELAYLGDSLVRPYSTVEGEAKLSVPSSVSGYFQWLIDQHNSRVSEAQRFDVGRNEGALLDKNDRIYRASSQMPTTSEELQSKLLDGPGGYVFVRRENGRRVIDYLADCVDVNAQVIDFGVNLLDYARTDSASSLYTAIRPKGGKPDGSDEYATLESLPDGTYSKDARFRKDGDVVYDAEAVRKYGMIELEWSDSEAVTADGLLDSAVIALKEHTSPKTTIEIKAVDMSMFMDGCSPLRPGQLVRVRSKPHGFDSYMLVAKIDPDLNDPSQTVYTLGTTFDAVTGETNKQIRRLNASINSAYDAMAPIGQAAKDAAEKAEAVDKIAKDAQERADAAQGSADKAQADADAAKLAADAAKAEADKAFADATQAAADAIAAKDKADQATAKVEVAESEMVVVKQAVAGAQAAADAAGTAAGEADAKAGAAQAAATGAQNTANTARAEAANAAKTATNYMQYTSAGLEVGNRSSGAWAGFRTRMTSSAFQVLDAAGSVLASYGANLVELGKGSQNAVIELCGSLARIMRSAVGGISITSAKRIDLTAYESGGGAVSSTMRVDASAGISIESSNGMRLGDGRVQSAKRLYDNASGTAGTVTLAETAASFDYLEILFGQDTRRRSVRVPAPNGKVASCSLMATNASACWWYVGLWSISGTAMTCAQNRTYNHGTADPTGSGEVRIYRVLGIKE